MDSAVLSTEMTLAYEKNIKGNPSTFYNRAVVNAANILQAFSSSNHMRQTSCNSQSNSVSGVHSSASMNGSFEALDVLERIEIS